MLEYYSTQYEFNHTIDELITIMKPWYDNYCFALKKYGKVTMYNSNMVLYFIDNYVNNDCEVPDHMIDENIRTDYNKLRMLRAMVESVPALIVSKKVRKYPSP